MTSTYEALQQELLRANNEVLVLKAKLLYPRIGGYKAKPFSKDLELLEPPRASEIKALWRWWMRVVLAGFYGGRKNYRELDAVAGELLGSTGHQSLFLVNVGFNQEQVRRFQEKGIKIYKLLRSSLNAFSKFIEECSIKGVNVNYVSLKPPFKIRLNLHIPGRENYVRARLRDELSKYLGVVPKLNIIRHRRQAEAIFTSSSHLAAFLKKYGLLGENVDPELYDEIIKLSRIPRYTLLLQRQRELRENDRLYKNRETLNQVELYIKRVTEELALPTELEVRISVLTKRHSASSLDEGKLKFAISTLLLSLVLGGLGSITRRAFGSIVSLNVEYFDEALANEIELLKGVFKANSEEELKNSIGELIRHCMELARELYHAGGAPSKDLPLVPSLIENTCFKLEAVECTGKDYVDILKLVGHSCLKQQWKVTLGGNPTDPGGTLHTWILGLPRSVGNTGYFVDGEGRRPSAIHLKLLEMQNGRKFIIIYGFLSRDWDVGSMMHKGTHYPQGRKVKSLKVAGLHGLRSPPQRDDNFIACVFEEAFSIVHEIIKMCSRR